MIFVCFFFHVKTKEHLVSSSPVRRPMALELQRGQCLGLAEKQPTIPVGNFHRSVMRMMPGVMLKMKPLPPGVTAAHMVLLKPRVEAIIKQLCLGKQDQMSKEVIPQKWWHVFCFFWMHHNDQHHGFWKNLRIHNQVPPTLTNITESLKLEGIGILEKNLSWWAFLAVWFFIELDERPDGESH